MLVVIDPGNFSTKYFFEQDGEISYNSFSSIAHDYIPFSDDTFSKKNLKLNRVEYLELDKYIGEDAKRFFKSKKIEKIYTGNTKKGHYDGILRIILALYKIYDITNQDSFELIITSPMKSSKKDKTFFEDKLLLNEKAIIDNKIFNFSINKIIVATEGLGAKEFVDNDDCIIIDGGSQTTNILHFIGGELTGNSTTINIGTENAPIIKIAESIFREFNNIDFEYPIRFTGGKSTELAEELESLGFINCLPIKHESIKNYFLNGFGIYKIAKAIGEI